MFKRLILIVIATVFFAWQFNSGSADALKIKESIRTVTLNEQGDTIVLSNEEAQSGARLFGSTCSKCHLQGKTKTNPDVGLGIEALAGAVPPRDNLLGLVDYMKYPTTYDGEDDLSLIHTNTQRSDLFPEMRNLTDQDLRDIAGHILIQANLDPKWGKRSLIEP